MGWDWLPEDSVTSIRADLERVFVALRALVTGTEPLDPNRSHVVEIAITISEAMERDTGGI